jgi:RimJ/RimL family protein N-acetyltransferase
MLKSLPICEDELSIRSWNRKDLDELAKWPGYPFPYEPFNSRLSEMNSEERDQHFRSQEDNPNRITLVVDHTTQKAIGCLSLVQIDWLDRIVGNMGFRIHPSWCNKGIGTLVIRKVSDWCFKFGLKTLRLDVAAANTRAIRCYEKAGYIKTEEFWRNDEGLKNIDINQPQYTFLRPHVQLDRDVPQIRFWWMELVNK